MYTNTVYIIRAPSILITCCFKVECQEKYQQSHENYYEAVPITFKELFYEMGCDFLEKTDESIKKEIFVWMANRKNQNQFSCKLSEKIRGDAENLPHELLNALNVKLTI